jgi:hypothetical protein
VVTLLVAFGLVLGAGQQPASAGKKVKTMERHRGCKNNRAGGTFCKSCPLVNLHGVPRDPVKRKAWNRARRQARASGQSTTGGQGQGKSISSTRRVKAQPKKKE